jgi:SAM-dependent methyltransferase
MTARGPSSAGQNLAGWIDAQPTFLGDSWVGQLEERKQEEARFHDKDREGRSDERESAEGARNRRFYEAAGPVQEELRRWLLTRTPGKVFLDYACGNGNVTLDAATAGAALAVGIDISAVSVDNAKETAAKTACADRTRFLQRDCENTGFPSSSFDACLCSGMLHHLDLTRAFPEIHRIMSPGGRVFCLEALAYNPVIQVYRNRTPELRTAWEAQHILSLREVRLAERWFKVENLKFHLLTAPLGTLLPKGRVRRTAVRLLHGIDTVLTRIPYLQLWSWQFSFELVKL